MIELLVLAAFILSLNAFVRARRATERVERELLALKEEVAALRAAGGVGGAPRVLVPEGQGAAATAVPADPQDQGETTPEALNEHCRTSDLLNFKRPREYVFVREIPKSPVGKILRRKLVAGEYESLPGNDKGAV